MTIALICPSNMLLMPYVKNYEAILTENNLDYEVINWDRNNSEELNVLTYRDRKSGHRRSFFDYWKYSLYIKQRLKEKKYEKLVVFGLQLAFFLKGILLNNYNNKFVLDIRDYNKIMKLYNFEKIIESSAFTVISSHGYRDWLPASSKYLINHNTRVDSTQLDEIKEGFDKEGEVLVSYIGSLTNLNQNIEFIELLKNNANYKLSYSGEGTINKSLEQYLKYNHIYNVEVSGKYLQDEEAKLYCKADLVNLIIDRNNLNSKTCLANRLYNAVIYGKPIVTLDGTYISVLVKKYKLGIVSENIENIKNDIEIYKNHFNLEEYSKGRKAFIEWVESENKYFKKSFLSLWK